MRNTKIDNPLLGNCFFYGLLSQKIMGPADKNYRGPNRKAIYIDKGIIWEGELDPAKFEKFIESSKLKQFKYGGGEFIRLF